MAFVVCETALAPVVTWGAPALAAGVWDQAPLRAGPKEIARIAAGLRSTLPIFTVLSYLFELGCREHVKRIWARLCGRSNGYFLTNRVTTGLRKWGVDRITLAQIITCKLRTKKLVRRTMEHCPRGSTG